MEVDICRQFVLHNDFIPPTSDIHSWDYLAFGYIDGISIAERNLLSASKKPLKYLWENNAATKGELLKRESRQVVYGFRTENEAANEDTLFWENIQHSFDYPFLFFIMIQFEDQGRKNLSKLLESRELVERKFNQENVKGITYLTLDNSNLLLILKSRFYEDGAEIIDQIHRKEPFFSDSENIWKVKYSFTIPAVSKEYLNDSNFETLNNKKMYQAYIYAMELSLGSIQAFYKKLFFEIKKDLKLNDENELANHICKQSILGYNDELIILKDIPWKTFLTFFKDSTGLLNHSNNTYQKYISCLTTIIGLRQNAETCNFGYQSGMSETQRKFFIFLQKRLEGFVSKYENNSYSDSMFLSIYHLLNSLSKFEKDNISENMFLPSALSIFLLVEILIDTYDNKVIFNINNIYREYRAFLNGLNSYAQNPIRSDRQITQIIELNVRTYNLPIKLNAFYNAFIYLVRDFLNETEGETEHFYEFLTCPGVSLHVYTKELFEGYSSNKRLCLVNIPESQVYNLEQMMIILGHEIGHYVGGQIRNRSARVICLFKALSRMIIIYYKNKLTLDQDISIDLWNELEKTLCGHIEKDYQDYYDINYIRQRFTDNEGRSSSKYCNNPEELAHFRKQHQDHGIILKNAFLDSSIHSIRENEDKLFQKFLYDIYMESYKKSDFNKKVAQSNRKKLENEIARASRRLFQISSYGTDNINIESLISTLLSLCKECLSDIIVIMTLELRVEQYMETFLDNAKEQGQLEQLMANPLNTTLIRLSLVFICMMITSKKRNLGYGWKQDYTLSISSSDDMVRLQTDINLFINKYYVNNCSNNFEPIGYIVNPDFCLDYYVLNEILKYLLKCRKCCADLIHRKKDKQKKILDIFGVCNTENIETAMLQIENFVGEYREQVLQKMDNIVNITNMERSK